MLSKIMLPPIERQCAKFNKYYHMRVMLKNTASYFAPTDIICLEQIPVYEKYIGLNRLWTKRREEKEEKYQARKRSIIWSFTQFRGKMDYQECYTKQRAWFICQRSVEGIQWFTPLSAIYHIPLWIFLYSLICRSFKFSNQF